MKNGTGFMKPFPLAGITIGKKYISIAQIVL